MVTIACQHCGKTVVARNPKRQKYCSHECHSAAMRGRPTKPLVEIVCLQCQQTFRCRPAWVKDGRRKFCSVTCRSAHQRTLLGPANPRYGKPNTVTAKTKMAKAAQLRELGRTQRGETHPAWKGGTYTHQGYRFISLNLLSAEDRDLALAMRPTRKHGQPYILEHRLVMARSLDRPLTSQESVHHINGDRGDNALDNLELLGTAEHSRLHREMVRELGKLRQQNHLLMSLLLTCLPNGQAISD